MSYREDFFRMLEGKTPRHDVMHYSFPPAAGEPSGMATLMGSFSDMGTRMQTGFDAWGLEYVWDSNQTGMIHKPGKYLLKDVTKWRDVVKAPDMTNYDWVAMSKKDWEVTPFDKGTQVSSIMSFLGDFFIKLAGFMGFEGALLAMHEEPEAVKELFNYFAEYDSMMIENICKYYQPEIIGFIDDNAAEYAPFISYTMFKELLFPFYKRLFDIAKQFNMIISYHNCGKCELFMDDMVKIGVQIWSCGSPQNDLVAFKNRHNNKVIIEVVPRMYPNFTEEQTRQCVRDTIDKYAPGGAFVWHGSTMANSDEGRQVDAWAKDEVKKYGAGFYDR